MSTRLHVLDGQERDPVRLTVVSGGVSNPSSTRMLTDRIAQKTVDALVASGDRVEIAVVDAGSIAVDIARALVSGLPSPAVQEAIDKVARADALIVGTPIYKAGISGLFKSFIDLLDNDLLLARPVVLAATGGSGRHAMVVDEQLRPLFAFLRALPTPTSVYVAPEDWGSSALSVRIDRAATELAALVRSGVAATITSENWARHDHVFGASPTRADRGIDEVDFSSALMRLAAGGSRLGPAVTPK